MKKAILKPPQSYINFQNGRLVTILKLQPTLSFSLFYSYFTHTLPYSCIAINKNSVIIIKIRFKKKQMQHRPFLTVT